MHETALPPRPRLTDERVRQLLLGHADAARFVLDLAYASHLYDDLVDRDKAATEAMLHQLWHLLWVDLPCNPFFRQHEAALRPAVVSAALSWRAATEIERAPLSVEELRIAHVIRYDLCAVAVLCAYLVGGHAHAASVARELRVAGQQDSWTHYLNEHIPGGSNG